MRAAQLSTPVAEKAAVKVREVLSLLQRCGWVVVATRGSHRQLKHPLRKGRVTVAGKASDDIAPGTLKSILREAGLDGGTR